MTNKATANLMLDGGMALAFVILVAPGIPQTDLHCYVGVVLGAGVLTHLALHAKWIGAMLRPGGRPLAAQARIDRTLDLILLVFFAITLVSGLLMWSAGGTASVESAGAAGGGELRGPVAAVGSGRGAVERGGRLGLHRGGDDSRLAGGSAHGASLWHVIHHASAILATIALLVHLAVHAKRVAFQIRRTVFNRSGRPAAAG